MKDDMNLFMCFKNCGCCDWNVLCSMNLFPKDNVWHLPWEEAFFSKDASHNKLCYQLWNVFCNLEDHHSTFLFNGRNVREGLGRLDTAGVHGCIFSCGGGVLYRITGLPGTFKSLASGHALKNKLFFFLYSTQLWSFQGCTLLLRKLFHSCLYLV